MQRCAREELIRSEDHIIEPSMITDEVKNMGMSCLHPEMFYAKTDELFYI